MEDVQSENSQRIIDVNQQLDQEYLVLSADLGDSTSFKGVFQNVFKDATQALYDCIAQDFKQKTKSLITNTSIGTGCVPELWKTIGDEVVYLVRVTKSHEVARILDAFIKCGRGQEKTIADIVSKTVKPLKKSGVHPSHDSLPIKLYAQTVRRGRL